MKDLISRAAAIDAMCDACSDWCDEGVCKKVSAIQRLPSAQPAQDCISRQAAIDAIIEWYGCEPSDLDYFKKIVEKLPSAQPEKAQLSREGTTSDCISRQAAIDALDKWESDLEWNAWCYQHKDEAEKYHIKAPTAVIDALPSAQPEPKRGRWILNNLNDGNGIVYHCTCCNWLTRHNQYAYCPNCGARMEG